MCLCCCLATSVSEAQPPGFLAAGTGAAGSHSSVDAASELELLPSVEAESVNAASLRASLSSSPALPILRCASPLYRAPSCRGAGTKYHHVPVRTRRASGVVHRAVLTCCCSAVRCGAAARCSVPRPALIARATRREGSVCGVWACARGVRFEPGGVEWSGVACPGSSWRFGLGETGAGGFKKFGSSIGKSDRWPGFTFQREKPRWNGTGGRHRQQQQQRATGVVGERRGNNETAGSA